MTMSMSIIQEFVQMTRHWNSNVDQFSDYYTHAGYTVGCKWSEWLKADEYYVTVDGGSDWSVLGLAARPVETKNLLACHKTHAGHVKRVLPRCIKAAHKVDINDEEQLKRYTHFLKCAKDIGAHPNFLTVEGVFLGNPNNREDMNKYYIITEAPCIALAKRLGRILHAKHLISPPILDEIVRELLSAINFLHCQSIVHHSISIDTIVCKTERSIVPIALVDIGYCGPEQFILEQEETTRYPYCSQESDMPRRERVYYKRVESTTGKVVSEADGHLIAPEIVNNRIRAQGNTEDFESIEQVGPPADIYQLGAAVCQLVQNSSGYICINRCPVHGQTDYERSIKLRTQRQYDLRNCYDCQFSYMNYVKFISTDLGFPRYGCDRGNKLEKTTSFQYYGKKYLNLVRSTLTFKKEARFTAQRLLKMWESNLRGPGGQVIKYACDKGSPCVTVVDAVPHSYGNLLFYREREAKLRGVPMITNNIIRECFIDKGFSGKLTREHGLLMMEHFCHQIVEDDEFSAIHNQLAYR